MDTFKEARARVLLFEAVLTTIDRSYRIDPNMLIRYGDLSGTLTEVLWCSVRCWDLGGIHHAYVIKTACAILKDAEVLTVGKTDGTALEYIREVGVLADLRHCHLMK